MSRFEKINRDQFIQRVEEYPWKRDITAVHVHHTWRPNHSQWKGEASIRGMHRYHTINNGWSDIAQHITIDPDGMIWLGRDWNKSPASSRGVNGTKWKGPFMFEMVGDFDVQKDNLEGDQLDTVLLVTSYMLFKFALPETAIKFHRFFAKKTCPGSALEYKKFVEMVEEHRQLNDLYPPILKEWH
jgi:hypothetical protein